MISISLKGRLGNQIFQYTICRLVAHINSYNFYIPEVGEPSTEGIHVKNFFDILIPHRKSLWGIVYFKC